MRVVDCLGGLQLTDFSLGTGLQRTLPLCALSFFFLEVALLVIVFYLLESSLLCCAMWQLFSALVFYRDWFEVI
jgi:hypothetical protein